MKRSFILASGMLALGAINTLSMTFSPLAVQPAAAQAVRTATFMVDNMTCALCPVTVKSAMKRVEGVQSVLIDFDARTATVTYDPSTTTVEAIGAASTNAGYPAAVQG